MEFNRQKKEELLLFLKEHFEDTNPILNSNCIEVQKNVISNYKKFDDNLYLVFELILPEIFNGIYVYYDSNNVLSEKKYIFKLGEDNISAKIIYSKHSFFEKEYMSKFEFKNLKNPENIFEFMLLPKEIVFYDENRNKLFAIELKIFLPLADIISSFNCLKIFKKRYSAINEIYSQIIKNQSTIFEMNMKSLDNFNFEIFKPVCLLDIFDLPKGLFIFNDFEVVIRTKQKKYFFKSENISIYITYNIKYFHFTSKEGIKRTFKWYFVAPY